MEPGADFVKDSEGRGQDTHQRKENCAPRMDCPISILALENSPPTSLLPLPSFPSLLPGHFWPPCAQEEHQEAQCRDLRALLKLLSHVTQRDIADLSGHTSYPGGGGGGTGTGVTSQQLDVAQVRGGRAGRCV